MNEILLALLLGGLGGLTRSTLGLFKAMAKSKKIVWSYWTITIVIAMIVGMFTGIIFSFDFRLALLAGYAGTDLLEGIYKAFSVEKFYVKH
jgi:fluoride ion exporter CrcB/FEX